MTWPPSHLLNWIILVNHSQQVDTSHLLGLNVLQPSLSFLRYVARQNIRAQKTFVDTTLTSRI